MPTRLNQGDSTVTINNTHQTQPFIYICFMGLIFKVIQMIGRTSDWAHVGAPLR
ncbi:MAG: hypothetical protein AB4426_31130 [Xenococcaceae cyanobacterium]